jgi:hypothetical protein
MNRLGTLRVSLLLAIGVVPLACGGTTQRGTDDGEGNDTGTGGSGTTNAGGATSTGRAGSGTAGTVGKMLPPTGGTGVGGATQTPSSCTGKLDPSTGLVACIEGYVHRARQVDCQSFGGSPPDVDNAGGVGGVEAVPVKPRADGSISCGAFGVGGDSGAEDCTRFALGYCFAGEGEIATCRSGCVTDADCGDGFICECSHPESPTGGACMRAIDCTTSVNCGPGLLCAIVDGGCGSHAYACWSPDDECRTSEDCAGGYCEYNQALQHRVCGGAACGRPFLVESVARMASVVPRRDWSGHAPSPRVDHLTASERQSLAQHWTQLGQMEHASIAAFARFSLQLLALGAPPELVDACTRALADETAHAKLCFGIASAFADRALGPGPLDIDQSLTVTSLSDVVDLVIAEGCIGETSAAVDALEAADAASDPVIRAAYAQIARDEQRHAELAFRFVRWALERDASSVRARIAAAIAAPASPHAAVRAVAMPCLAALLELTSQELTASHRNTTQHTA